MLSRGWSGLGRERERETWGNPRSGTDKFQLRQVQALQEALTVKLDAEYDFGKSVKFSMQCKT